MFHMAIKQVTTLPDGDLREEWIDYLFAINNVLGAKRMRHWWWPYIGDEGC